MAGAVKHPRFYEASRSVLQRAGAFMSIFIEDIRAPDE